MTVEELKAEADALGYNIVKKPYMVQRVACTCGRKRPVTWYTTKGLYFECPDCGRVSDVGKTKNEAIELWNKAVLESDCATGNHN